MFAQQRRQEYPAQQMEVERSKPYPEQPREQEEFNQNYMRVSRSLLNGTAPAHFFESYDVFLKFVRGASLDSHKDSLSQLLFPVFVNLFLQMVRKNFIRESQEFFNKYRAQFQS